MLALYSEMWIVVDWAGNVCLGGKGFLSFDHAEDVLCSFLGRNYDTDRCEYYIIEKHRKAG